MQIDNSQLSLEMSRRYVNADTSIGQGTGRALAAGAGAGSSGGPAISAGADQVEISGAARSASIGGRDDLQQMDPVERLAAMALEAMVGHRVRWLGFRPPVAIGDEGPEIPQAAQAEAEKEAEQARAQADAKAAAAADDHGVRRDAPAQTQPESQPQSVAASAPASLAASFGQGPAQAPVGQIVSVLNTADAPSDHLFGAAGSPNGAPAPDANGGK